MQFPEGALTAPNKRVVSSAGPEIVAEADWSTVDRGAIKAEVDAVAETARQLGLWTVVGGIDFSANGPTTDQRSVRHLQKWCHCRPV